MSEGTRAEMDARLGLERVGEIDVGRMAGSGVSPRIGVGFETLDRFMFDAEKADPHLRKLGAGWARIQTGWSRCEPDRGRYDFGWLDGIVGNLLDAGVTPLFSVSFGNAGYMPDAPHESAVGCVPIHYGTEVEDAWSAYVRALAAHFADRVRHWEVWNEPNIPQFWSSGPVSGSDYARLVELTATAVRAEHPTATIVGGALSLSDMGYLEDALRAGLAEHIDVFSFHPYQAVPEHNLRNMVDVVRRLLRRYGSGREIGIIQGENGCPSQLEGHHDDWLGMYHIDQSVQARWVARRIIADLEAGFDVTFYFHLVDLIDRPYRQAGSKINLPVLMGLVHGRSYEPKHSYDVLRRLCALFDERAERRDLMFLFSERDPAEPGRSGRLAAPFVAGFVRDGAPMFAYWLSEDPQQASGVAEIDVEMWWDHDLRLDDPVVVDPLTGAICRLRQHEEFIGRDWRAVGHKYRVPLADYPLIITDRRVVAGAQETVA